MRVVMGFLVSGVLSLWVGLAPVFADYTVTTASGVSLTTPTAGSTAITLCSATSTILHNQLSVPGGRRVQGQVQVDFIQSDGTRLPVNPQPWDPDGLDPINVNVTGPISVDIQVTVPPASTWPITVPSAQRGGAPDLREVQITPQLFVFDTATGVQLDTLGPGQSYDLNCDNPPPPQENGGSCPATPGYWKNHSGLAPGNQKDVWPVHTLTLGSHTYTESEVVTLFKDFSPSGSGDASMILGYQLFAAKLNVASGSANAGSIATAISTADSLLAAQGSGSLPYNISPSSTVGQQMVGVAATLDAYNNSSPAGCTLR